ncbi:unnamed protein product [Urochloa humidicola]
MAKAHVLVFPFPAQGHVTPLMELSHRLVDHGFEVTFVNTEAHHALVVGALQAAGGPSALAGIHLASISDGVEDDDERKDICKLVDAYARNMPGKLERLCRRNGDSREAQSEVAHLRRVRVVVIRRRQTVGHPGGFILAGVGGVLSH